MEILGIDIGGSGMKAAVVETKTGEWLTDRYRVETPRPAKHDHMVDALKDIAGHFKWKGPVGCGFPGVITQQKAMTAANLHKSLIGTELGQEMTEFFGQPAWLINDADAAGLAELHFGLGDRPSVVLFLTIGTGIGTAYFTDGQLVPNTELGHMLMDCGKGKFMEAEHYCADSARRRDDLKWSEWAKRFDEFLHAIWALTRADEIIVGGGVAKRGHKFMDHLTPPCPLHLAKLENRAGIIGAALAAEKYGV